MRTQPDPKPNHHPKNHRTHDPVTFRGGGVLRPGDRMIEHVHADLVGDRNRYSVGGEIAEGLRWWRGRLEWTGNDEQPTGGSQVVTDLDNGRSGTAVIEPDPTAPAHTTVVHGVGPSPLDVP